MNLHQPNANEALQTVGQTCEAVRQLLKQISQGGDPASVVFPVGLNITQGGQNILSSPKSLGLPALSPPTLVRTGLIEEIFRRLDWNE